MTGGGWVPFERLPIGAVFRLTGRLEVSPAEKRPPWSTPGKCTYRKVDETGFVIEAWEPGTWTTLDDPVDAYGDAVLRLMSPRVKVWFQ